MSFFVDGRVAETHANLVSLARLGIVGIVVILQIRIGDGRVVEDLVIERLLAVPFEAEEEERERDHGIE